MSEVRSRRQRELQKAQEAFPVIVEGLREGREPVELSAEVAKSFDVDDVLAYRWVDIIGQQFRRAVRRTALVGISLLWVALAAIVAVVVLVLSGHPEDAGFPLWLLLSVLGALLAGVGLFLSLRAKRLVLRSSRGIEGGLG